MPTRKYPVAKRALALGLTVAMLCPPCSSLIAAAQAQGSTAPAAPAAAKGIKSLLLFPFANNANDPTADNVAARVDDAIKLRINTVGVFKATSFSHLLPTVQRSLDDNVLTKDDVTPPFSDSSHAGKVATEVATDGYLIGAVESYKVDNATKNVTLEVSANLYNTTSGASLGTFAFTGHGVATSTGEDQDAVVQSAIDDVSAKIVSALNANAPRTVAAPTGPPPGRSKTGQNVLFGLLAVGLLTAILSNSNHSSGGGSGAISTGGTGGGTTGGSGGPPAPP